MKTRFLCTLFVFSIATSILAQSPYISRVFEFMPAPGQFVNEMPYSAIGYFHKGNSGIVQRSHIGVLTAALGEECSPVKLDSEKLAADLGGDDRGIEIKKKPVDLVKLLGSFGVCALRIHKYLRFVW